MGIDWSRMRPKHGVDSVRLDRLIEQQALSAQAMWGWQTHAGIEADPVGQRVLGRVFLATYRGASSALFNLLDFPGWDDRGGCAVDDPGIDPSWRVLAIHGNPIFPPPWRVEALRTIHPDRLGQQVSAWKTWAEQVQSGQHDHYLRELHLHATSDWLWYHWTYLRRYAADSPERDEDWAKSPELTELRDEIIRFPEPLVWDVRLEPSDDPGPFGGPGRAFDIDSYNATFRDVRSIIELTRRWDSLVPEGRKIGYGEEAYSLSLDQFRDKASDPWLRGFFRWVDRCASSGFGLFLDY
jgi:hypothetical protein